MSYRPWQSLEVCLFFDKFLSGVAVSLTRLAQAKKPDLIVFTHIPKTGGGSLTQIFRDNFPAEQIVDISQLKLREVPDSLAQSLLRQEIQRLDRSVRVIHGHVNFSYDVQRYLDRDCTSMTLLRDPVERVVSLYYFVRRLNNGNKIAAEIMRKNLSLDDFALYETFQPMDNIQVRYLANSRGPDSNLQSCHRYLLEEAKANLIDRFDMFGVTEDFGSFAMRVCKDFNLAYDPSHRLNSSGRPPLEEISTETLEKIRQRNAFDLELWEFAKKHLVAA